MKTFFKILITVSLLFSFFVAYQRIKFKKNILSNQKWMYLYFDCYASQYGYPSNKEQLNSFVQYCTDVNGYKSNIWNYEHFIENSKDSVKVYLKSNYFITDLVLLKVKKRGFPKSINPT